MPAAHWIARMASLPRRHRELGRHALLYLVAGGATTLLQALLYLTARAPLGAYAANLVAIGITTVANTEFHRLVTFAGAEAAAARRHLQTVATFAFYACAGSTVLLVLHSTVEHPSPTLETALLVATTVAGGVARFLVLRTWVFRRRVKMTE